MEHGERIPIVIEELAVTSDRETLRENGTLVIDIRTPPAGCENPEVTSNGDEIVVCAVGGAEAHMLGEAVPDQPTAMQRLGEALHTQIGPLEIGSIDIGDGARTLGLRTRF